VTNPLPDLEPAEYNALLEDIERRGIVYPVIRDQHGVTVDGHQRERVAATLGIDLDRLGLVKVVEITDPAEREAVALALNVHRRHLTPQAKRAAIARLAATGMTQAEIGRAVGVTQQAVSKVIADEGIQPVVTPPADEPVALDRQGRAPGEDGRVERLLVDAPHLADDLEDAREQKPATALRELYNGRRRQGRLKGSPKGRSGKTGGWTRKGGVL